MSLRAFTLMVVLGLHSAGSAAAGLVHLCQGQPRLQARCCCERDTQAAQDKAAAMGMAPAMGAPQDTCCQLLGVDPAPTPSATMPDAERRWEAPHLAALPLAPSAILPLALDTFALKWARARGVSQATAPPLYLQHCSYLI